MKDKLKIAIDATQVIYGTGTSVYTKNLIQNLLSIDKTNQYILFGGSLRRTGDLQSFFSTLKGNKTTKVYRISPTIADTIWNRLHVLPIEALIGQTDVFHSSDWVQPPSKAFKVTTVHDLSPLLFPKLTHPRIVATHKRRLHWVSKEVDQVIVPSRSTMVDLINYGVSEKKISVVAEAPDPYFKTVKSSTSNSVKDKYQILKPFLLGIGVSERKNTMRIIESFKKGGFDKHYSLVLVGNLVSVSDISTADIVFTGHISNEELRQFYNFAEALIYPSIYEGFGLPILEAFACGCPVLTSNVSSMKEIAENAAVLVDPLSVESILQGIREVTKDRDKYINKGRLRLKMFSWEAAARQTLDIYMQKERKL